jgi:hypothetical protein
VAPLPSQRLPLFLHKPYAVRDLLLAVKEVLDEKQKS